MLDVIYTITNVTDSRALVLRNGGWIVTLETIMGEAVMNHGHLRIKSVKSVVNEPLVSLNCGLYHVGDVAYLRFWTGMSSWSQRFQDQYCPRSALG